MLNVLGGEYRSVFLAKNAPHASAHEKAIIMRISSKFLDFKWEFVEDLLYWVILALPLFQMCFDAAAFRGSAEDKDNLGVVKSSNAWEGLTRVVQVVACWRQAAAPSRF